MRRRETTLDLGTSTCGSRVPGTCDRACGLLRVSCAPWPTTLYINALKCGTCAHLSLSPRLARRDRRAHTTVCSRHGHAPPASALAPRGRRVGERRAARAAARSPHWRVPRGACGVAAQIKKKRPVYRVAEVGECIQISGRMQRTPAQVLTQRQNRQQSALPALPPTPSPGPTPSRGPVLSCPNAYA